MNQLDEIKSASPLGKQSAYEVNYNPKLLFPIPRDLKRKEIGIRDALPFRGVDIWNAYELSWLNTQGKPMVAIATFTVPHDSPNIFESKSLKLYLNTFNSTKFPDINAVKQTLEKDLSAATQSSVEAKIDLIQRISNLHFTQLPGTNIDDLDVAIETYQPKVDYLKTEGDEIEEELNSHLLKSNCLVTNQPDWGSLYMKYKGKKINHEGLLKYIISLREHNEFHEQCVERIFMHILQRCKPSGLTVYARYTRRGGIDINPFRTTDKSFSVSNMRLIRQ